MQLLLKDVLRYYIIVILPDCAKCSQKIELCNEIFLNIFLGTAIDKYMILAYNLL